jgi:hypothetical protein
MGARSSERCEGRGATVLVVRALIGGGFLAVTMLLPTVAASQGTPSQSQSENSGDDLFRPPPNLFQMMYQYQTAPGSGSTPGSIREVTTDTLNLRMFQGTLIHDINQRWTVGFGARLTAPTGGDTLGSGKWQIMPGAGVRYALPEINSSSYLEPVVRYNVSFAGDPTKKNISNLQFAPTFNLGLPDRWFITFYPSADIRINYGDPITGQTGRLFLPFDARIGRKLSDNIALSLEVGVPIIKDYPVYNLKTQVRFNMTY